MVDDLETFDGLETVTLSIGATPYVVTALRRPLVPRVESGVQSDRAAWHLRAAELAGAEPGVGDSLVAGAETWTVEETERVSFGTRWRLVCERAV